MDEEERDIKDEYPAHINQLSDANGCKILGKELHRIDYFLYKEIEEGGTRENAYYRADGCRGEELRGLFRKLR